MGWSSGTYLFEEVINIVEECVPPDAKRKAYRMFIEAFMQHDWDNLDEVLGKSADYDAVFSEMYPPEVK